MNHYSHIPMIRIFLPLCAGVIIYVYSDFYIAPILIAGVFIILFLLLAISFRFTLNNYRFRYIHGVIFHLIFISLGLALTQSRDHSIQPSHFSNFKLNDAHLRVQLTEPIAEKDNSWQLKGTVKQIINTDTLIDVKGKLIIYLEKDSLASQLRFGDIIITPSQTQEIGGISNPHAFNYKKFLANQNIFHQAYFRSQEWTKTGSNQGSFLLKFAYLLRQKALETMEHNGINNREFAVASALLLGYRDFLDPELQQDFAGAGAMHILCVSGLHVGIIFAALNLLLMFFNKIKHGRKIKTLLIIILIWFYAAITGLSPSVLRASTMFSFISVALIFSRNTNIYNTLAASAIFLTILDPFIIFKIGFQLSYIAVLSIILLQPILYKQLYFKNKIGRYLWGLVTVSIAAQAGTGPLAIYYFNQFPNYFLITNIIVIPLTFLILITGISFFLVSFIPFLVKWVGFLLSLMVKILHKSVGYIENLPFSTSAGITLTLLEMILILSIISLIYIFITQKHKQVIIYTALFALILTTSLSFRKIEKQQQKSLIIYDTPGSTSLDIFEGIQCYTFYCNQNPPDKKSIMFNISGNRIKNGIHKENQHKFYKHTDTILGESVAFKENVIQWEDLQIKLIDNSEILTAEQIYPDTLDLLIITGNPDISIAALSDTYYSDQLVFDSSTNWWNNKDWMQECDSLDIDCWSVRDQGAFIMDL